MGLLLSFIPRLEAGDFVHAGCVCVFSHKLWPLVVGDFAFLGHLIFKTLIYPCGVGKGTGFTLVHEH